MDVTYDFRESPLSVRNESLFNSDSNYTVIMNN